MTLRQIGLFVIVICDTCGTEHETTETVPVLAQYDATLRHGWVPGGRFEPRRPGTHCPSCWTGGPIPRER